jgi:hypothetical protein
MDNPSDYEVEAWQQKHTSNSVTIRRTSMSIRSSRGGGGKRCGSGIEYGRVTNDQANGQPLDAGPERLAR